MDMNEIVRRANWLLLPVSILRLRFYPKMNQTIGSEVLKIASLQLSQVQKINPNTFPPLLQRQNYLHNHFIALYFYYILTLSHFKVFNYSKEFKGNTNKNDTYWT